MEIKTAIDNLEKRDAYDKVLDFINSKRCYEGTVCVHGRISTCPCDIGNSKQEIE